MPALPLDVALLHVDRASARGVCQIKGPDHYMDDLFAPGPPGRCSSAATNPSMTGSSTTPGRRATCTVFWERAVTTGVVHLPCGAHPSSCAPLYGFDVKHFKEYAASARESGGWAAYFERYVACGEARST